MVKLITNRHDCVVPEMVVFLTAAKTASDAASACSSRQSEATFLAQVIKECRVRFKHKFCFHHETKFNERKINIDAGERSQSGGGNGSRSKK
jgi:hypothetical protein